MKRIEERFEEKFGSRQLGRTRLSGRSTILERERKSANSSARACDPGHGTNVVSLTSGEVS